MTREFKVTKEHFEDLIGEPDAQGRYEVEYRYWVYRFVFGDHGYRARIYTDEPDHANVFRDDVDYIPLGDPSEIDRLRAIRCHLENEPLPGQVDGTHIDIRVLARKGDDYVSVPLDD